MKVAVIGGGLAGLCAAMDLAEGGAEVVVYEKYPALGGLAAAFDIGGTKLERFYHHVFSTDLDLLNLLDELGLQDKIGWYSENNGSWYKNCWYPFTTPVDILKFPPLPFIDRLRLGFGVKWMSLKKNHKPFEPITSKYWIEKVMGRKVWQVVWEPLFKSKFGKWSDRVSATWFFGRCTARFGPSKPGAPTGKLGYLDGSTQVMVDALVKKLELKGVELRTSTAVKALRAENGVISGVESSKGFETCDKVVVTCATPQFLKIARNILPPQDVPVLESFRYHGSIIEVLEYSQQLSPVYWMNVLDTEAPFLAIIEQTNMIPPEKYQGKHILYLARYLDTADDFYKAGNDEIIEHFEGWLKRVLPAFDKSKVLGRHIMKASYTQPIVEVNYGAKIPAHRLAVKGLYLANMTQIYPQDRGMSYSIGLGRKVARMMLEDK